MLAADSPSSVSTFDGLLVVVDRESVRAEVGEAMGVDEYRQALEDVLWSSWEVGVDSSDLNAAGVYCGARRLDVGPVGGDFGLAGEVERSPGAVCRQGPSPEYALDLVDEVARAQRMIVAALAEVGAAPPTPRRREVELGL